MINIKCGSPVLKAVVSGIIIGHCKTARTDSRSNEKNPFSYPAWEMSVLLVSLQGKGQSLPTSLGLSVFWAVQKDTGRK